MHSWEMYQDLLRRYLRPFRRKVALLAVLLLGSIGLQLLNPQILRWFIDAAMAATPLRALLTAAFLFLSISIVDQLLVVGATYVSQDVGWSATNLLRKDVFRHCLRLDLPFHNTHTPGILIERIDGDVSALSNFFSEFVIRVLGSGLTLFGILVLLFTIDWRVGAGLSTFVCATLVALVLIRNSAVPYAKEERQANAVLYGFLEERLSGIADIRANGAAAYVMHRYYEVMRDLLHKGRMAWVTRTSTWSVSQVLFAMGTAAGLGMGIWLYYQGAVTIGTVYLVYFYTGMVFRPLEQITRQVQDLQRAAAGVIRISQILQTQSSIVDNEGTLPSGSLQVEFADVSFAYDDEGLVLEDVSLRLDAGQTLGLLGRTGSGKSTIARLLTRLYDPTAGVISMGGVDIRAASLAELRERIGVVTQDVQLFYGTVRENLTLFDTQIPDTKLEEALAHLGLTEWLSTLPAGLDTLLEAGSGGLSAGEAQLLAFTRVFLKDPGLIILDEASSRLDPETEKLVEVAISKLLAGRTGIIIAHRMATVRRADQILILENGEIQEYGERAALESDTASRFAQLLRTGLEVFELSDGYVENVSERQVSGNEHCSS